MRCSKCSEVVKPVVAVDMDGTLGDYHGHFIRFAAEWLGMNPELTFKCTMDMYGGAEPFSGYMMRVAEIDLSTYRDIKLAYRQGGMKRSMPIIQMAKATCSNIKKDGAELWITTTRPYLSFDGIVPDTLAWFDRHQIAFDNLLFDEDKYAILANRVDSERVVAVLDDLGEMYDAASEHFGADVPILIAGNFNINIRRQYKMGLLEAGREVSHRINKWKEAHHG